MINFSNANGLAKISYGSSDYLIMEAGSYVLCAVTGKQIPLEQLKYWNDELQEAYIDAAASLKRWQETQSAS
ncbi:MAG: DUF2093 domain-containing protein [Acidimicrobiales bacterium]|nr:DUF2093 domain-containing protein [Hyphomonadaceae bacterium]RZV42120.1 MAG: DUF2093 domain-containing protein [Acidimicrobiales bacterium]